MSLETINDTTKDQVTEAVDPMCYLIIKTVEAISNSLEQ
jgi:hypothetical protein